MSDETENHTNAKRIINRDVVKRVFGHASDHPAIHNQYENQGYIEIDKEGYFSPIAKNEF